MRNCNADADVDVCFGGQCRPGVGADYLERQSAPRLFGLESVSGLAAADFRAAGLREIPDWLRTKLALLRPDRRVAAVFPKRSVHLHRPDPSDDAVQCSFLGGPGLDSFVRADRAGVRIRFVVPDAIGRHEDAGARRELGLHRGGLGFEQFRYLPGTHSALQQLGRCVPTGEDLPRPGQLGGRSAGQFHLVFISGPVRDLSLYRLRVALWPDPLATGVGHGGAAQDWTTRPGVKSISMMSRAKRILTGLAALMIGFVVWLPCLHLFFAKSASEFVQAKGLSPRARELAAEQLQFWTDPHLRDRELRRMRASNAEWDFMGRSFLVSQA